MANDISVGFDMDVVVDLSAFDRAIAKVEEAGNRATSEMVDTTAQFASEQAPVGPGRSPRQYARRPKLSSNIKGEMTARTTGYVRATPGHAAAQEVGARPHPIPNAFGSGRTVIHPGNAPQPYLRPAFQRLRAVARTILERYYNLG